MSCNSKKRHPAATILEWRKTEFQMFNTIDFNLNNSDLYELLWNGVDMKEHNSNNAFHTMLSGAAYPILVNAATRNEAHMQKSHNCHTPEFLNSRPTVSNTMNCQLSTALLEYLEKKKGGEE